MEQLTQYISILSVTEWLMLSAVLVLVISLVSLKRQRRLRDLHSLSMESLQRDLRALANAAVGVGERVLVIERQQRKLPSNIQPSQEKLATPVEYYNSASQPYEQAIRMAQSGANANEIVKVCNLSLSEAELIAMMHRLDKAS